MKLLVIQTGGIGEILLSTPVIRCLKTQLNDAEVHVLLKPGNSPLVEHNPHIDKLVTDQEALNGEEFDHVIDIAGSKTSRRITRALGFPVLRYKRPSFRMAVFTTLKWNLMPRGRHIADRFLQTVAPLGPADDGLGLDLFIPAEKEVTERDIPASHQLGYVALTVGASKYTRRLPPAKLQEICKAIDHPVMLLGSEKEFAHGEAIAAFDPVKVYNACGKFDLLETADLVRKSKLLIAHDTGLMQMAAAFNKPVIGVWGSTTAWFGRGPYYAPRHVKLNPSAADHVYVKNLWCRPCTSVGRDQCPLGHFKCMKQIPVYLLVQKLNSRLKEISLAARP